MRLGDGGMSAGCVPKGFKCGQCGHFVQLCIDAALFGDASDKICVLHNPPLGCSLFELFHSCSVLYPRPGKSAPSGHTAA